MGRSKRTVEERFWRRVDKRGPDDCWDWKGSTRNGYGLFFVNGKQRMAHQIAFELTEGEPLKPGELVRHFVCDRHSCCNPAHLRRGTYQDNSDDKWAKGRANPGRGLKHGNAKLTREKIETVMRLYYRGAANETELAAGLGVSWGTIRHVVLGHTYSEITQPLLKVYNPKIYQPDRIETWSSSDVVAIAWLKKNGLPDYAMPEHLRQAALLAGGEG
jgi:hypothetical protein